VTTFRIIQLHWNKANLLFNSTISFLKAGNNVIVLYLQEELTLNKSNQAIIQELLPANQ
jgi:hypothetical protein